MKLSKLNKINASAILLAGGSGERMGENKLLMRFCGKTVLQLGFSALAHSNVDEIIIAASDEVSDEALSLAKASEKNVIIVSGGKTRGESVYNALKKCSGEIIAIHDCARCLAASELVNATIAAAREHGSGIAALPVYDTVRNKNTHDIIEREALILMQTPQTFDAEKIKAAYEKCVLDGALAFYTDDCAIYNAYGYDPYYVGGGIMNQKLTTRGQLPFFNAATADFRIGFGEDTHRLTDGRKLIIGGVDIPYRMGLLGHSDADVALHAAIDALLGAASLGDIGSHFPDKDEKYRGISSIELLKATALLIAESGYSVNNLDITVIAQEPKLAPYITAMRQNIAQTLSIQLDSISVKATTPEHTGPEGRLECISARAVASLR